MLLNKQLLKLNRGKNYTVVKKKCFFFFFFTNISKFGKIKLSIFQYAYSFMKKQIIYDISEEVGLESKAYRCIHNHQLTGIYYI